VNKRSLLWILLAWFGKGACKLVKPIVVIAAILILMLQVPICMSQPTTGDWIVTGTEVIENRSISLDGNLTIKSGGSLTLRNATLTLDIQYSGQHGISVEENGALFIFNSSISSATENRFSFVANGSSFVMKNSKLKGVGWELPPGDTAQSCVVNPEGLSHFGLLVATDQAVILDNIFSGNDIGLILSGSDGTIARNLFSYNTLFTILVYQSHNNTFANNTLLQNPATFSTSMVQLWSAAENNTFAATH
jgi:parallel beta-helix repeat protein